MNFFRSDSLKGDPMYGNGFKGLLKAQFGSFGEDGAVGLEATVLFGTVNGYRYWFADALATIPTGIPAGPVSIYGFGGGAFYHMKQIGVKDNTISDIGKSISVAIKALRRNNNLSLKKIQKQIDTKKGKLNISWQSPEKEVMHYKIYRKSKTTTYTLHETIDGAKTNFEDNKLKLGDFYVYRIKVIYTDGSVSGFTKEITVKF